MSLIEQAARRLEELRRAGVELPQEAVSHAGQHAIAEVDGNVPEALIKALEERTVELPVAPASRPAVHSRGRARQEPAPPIRPETRSVEINLPRLKTLGFVTPDAPTSRIADEFRVVKRPIIRNALGQGESNVHHGNLIMVTSALPGEGKTFTSINLAMSMAMEFDSRVLLVDGDVAHPSMPGMLGAPHSPGLLDLLTRDDIDVADALVRTNIDRLTLLPAGARHRRSTELLASEQMASLLRELQSRYPDRIIIFDSPPLLATTEARVLATHMGQILMVVAADATSHHALEQALTTIESCDIVLMLLNKATRTDVGTYYGYYGDDEAK